MLGAFYGDTSTTGTTLNGSGIDFSDMGLVPGTFSGSFSTQSALSLTTSGGVKINAAYQAAYELPAALGQIAGTFRGSAATARTGDGPIDVNITSEGRITSSGAGCSLSGTVAPRDSGKNIFDLSITFSGAACALGNGANVRGIAYYEMPTRRLIAMALNGAKTDGFVYLASPTTTPGDTDDGSSQPTPPDPTTQFTASLTGAGVTARQFSTSTSNTSTSGNPISGVTVKTTTIQTTVPGLSLTLSDTKQPLFNGGTLDWLSVVLVDINASISGVPSSSYGSGMCFLPTSNPMPTIYPPCSDLGINFNRASGSVAFDAVNFTIIPGSGAQFVVDGSLSFTPY